MNGLGKPFRKKSDPKNRKNSENQSEIAACEQKTTTQKPNFCSNTVFSLYFKIIAKIFTAKKNHSLFAPFLVSAWQKSPLQFDFKNHENVWTDLKKNEAGHVLTYNSNNFHWLNRKLDLERTMNELENQLERNLIQKTEKTVKIKVKLPHGNKKPPARKRIFVQTPFSHSTLK